MKQGILLLSFFLTALFATAQNYSVAWGDEIKLKKGTADLEIIAADKTGLYFTEKRRTAGMFSIGGGVSAYKLYKFDKTFSEVFEKEYKKELKGFDFHSFQQLDNDLFLFATDYIKKEKTFKIYGAKIDKGTGDLQGDFNLLGFYTLENKRDDFELNVSPAQNGTGLLLVSNVSASDRASVAVSLLDKSFRKKESTIINLSYEANLYELEDVRITKNNRIVLLGKEYEETTFGRKKKKRLVFKQYVMSVYNPEGIKISGVAIDTDDRYIISGKLIEHPDGKLLLAGFYSNSPKKEDLSGFYINIVDADNGVLQLSSFKEINSGMLGKAYLDESDDDDDTRESKKQAKKAKDDDDEEEFPNRFVIKSVDINPGDNSIVITSEVSRYAFYSFTNSSYNPTTRTWTRTTTFVHRFTNQDILIIHADRNGEIKWLNAMPKAQLEEVRTNSSSTGPGLNWNYDRGGYFARGGGMPYYSSFKSIIRNNNLILVLNDHNSNNVNPNYGDKVKTIYNFRKRSTTYGVTVDLATGKMTRKIIASNNDETIMMPRHSYLVGNELFVPSWRIKTIGKTELRFAKITIR